MTLSRSTIALFCILLAPLGSSAQDRIVTEGRQCVAIADGARRLACFDGVFASAGAAATEAAAGARPASTAAIPDANATGDFGLTEAQKQARNPDAVKVTGPKEVTGVVSSIDRRRTGEVVVTLDNGQVWVQSDMSTTLRVRAGSTVSITSGALGSYFLSGDGRPPVRVRRVK
jgi:hypothetical protein